jgi:hypothetical protein
VTDQRRRLARRAGLVAFAVVLLAGWFVLPSYLMSARPRAVLFPQVERCGLSFSSDSKMLFTAGRPASLQVWDAASGQELLSVPEAAGPAGPEYGWC